MWRCTNQQSIPCDHHLAGANGLCDPWRPLERPNPFETPPWLELPRVRQCHATILRFPGPPSGFELRLSGGDEAHQRKQPGQGRAMVSEGCLQCSAARLKGVDEDIEIFDGHKPRIVEVRLVDPFFEGMHKGVEVLDVHEPLAVKVGRARQLEPAPIAFRCGTLRHGAPERNCHRIPIHSTQESRAAGSPTARACRTARRGNRWVRLLSSLPRRRGRRRQSLPYRRIPSRRSRRWGYQLRTPGRTRRSPPCRRTQCRRRPQGTRKWGE